MNPIRRQYTFQWFGRPWALHVQRGFIAGYVQVGPLGILWFGHRAH